MATNARFLVLWSRPEDPASFERHYREVHVPLALQIPRLRRYTLSRNVRLIRGEDPYYLVGELDFDDRASLEAAFQSPEGQATAADTAKLAEEVPVRSMIYELEDQLG